MVILLVQFHADVNIKGYVSTESSSAVIFLAAQDNTMFMLIERMIQLPQENSIPGILLERKWLSVIIFYESN